MGSIEQKPRVTTVCRQTVAIGGGGGTLQSSRATEMVALAGDTGGAQSLRERGLVRDLTSGPVVDGAGDRYRSWHVSHLRLHVGLSLRFKDEG